MTINDIIQADWNIDQLDITVRDASTTKYIMRYCIGRDVKPGRSERFRYEAECGDVYTSTVGEFITKKQYEKLCELGFEDNPYVKHWCRWHT